MTLPEGWRWYGDTAVLLGAARARGVARIVDEGLTVELGTEYTGDRDAEHGPLVPADTYERVPIEVVAALLRAAGWTVTPPGGREP